MIKLIAIVDAKYGLSKNGKIEWSFSEDLSFFRYKTIGQPVIMGSKTYFSLSNRPLEQRTNCVISHSITQLPKCIIFNSLESAVKAYPDTWLIGGESIYNYALSHNLVQYALVTVVHNDYGADQFLKSEYFPTTYNIIFYNQNYEIREYKF